MYRFALRGRWLVGHVVILVLVGLFILAGFWQLDRLDQRRAHNALVRSREAMAPVDLRSLVSAADDRGGDATYRDVNVTGRYDRERQVIVPFRTLGEEPGELLLTPLALDDGTAVVVSRGWIPASDPTQPVPPIAAPPQGMVTVTGLALASEGGTAPFQPGTAGAGEPLTQIARVDLARLQRQLPYDLFPVYVQLQQQDPAQAEGLPTPLPPPDLSEGPHLSYAIQWFLFTAIAVVGWPLVIRKAAKERAGLRASPVSEPVAPSSAHSAQQLNRS